MKYIIATILVISFCTSNAQYKKYKIKDCDYFTIVNEDSTEFIKEPVGDRAVYLYYKKVKKNGHTNYIYDHFTYLKKKRFIFSYYSL